MGLLAVLLLWLVMIAIAFGLWRGRKDPMPSSVSRDVWWWGLAAGAVCAVALAVALIVTLGSGASGSVLLGVIVALGLGAAIVAVTVGRWRGRHKP